MDVADEALQYVRAPASKQACGRCIVAFLKEQGLGREELLKLAGRDPRAAA